MGYIGIGVILLVLLLLVGPAIRTIDQANVGVVTMFGKFRRILNPGLNIIIPFFEVVRQRVSVQNQTEQLNFSTITIDQASVHFTATIIYTVTDHQEETIKLVAFKFIDQASFQKALTSAVESSVRSFVATKKQADILGLREEIVSHSKANLDEQLASWGYTIVDLQITDLAFDSEVMASMSKVVAAKNAQVSAEFEGQALLIQRTKAAEAEGAAIRIAAENEAEANRLRGVGLANFRKELTAGIAESAESLKEQGIDPAFLGFSMWTEMIRDASREGTGNTIFLDGNAGTMEDTMRRMQGIMNAKNMDAKPKKNPSQGDPRKAAQDPNLPKN